MSVESTILERWIPDGARVLDLACGDGALLAHLRDTKGVKGYGLEIDPTQISACLARGVNVIEQEIVRDLDAFRDQSFDLVIMTQALQVMKYPDVVLREMLRVGKRCIVTFPNFGNVRARLHLTLAGRMPVTKKLPYEWYNTPNIHFCTVADFRALCQAQAYRVLNQAMIAEQPINRQFKDLWPNLFAETAIYHLTCQQPS